MDAVAVLHEFIFSDVDVHGAVERTQTAVGAAFQVSSDLFPLNPDRITQPLEDVHQSRIGTEEAAPNPIAETGYQ